MELASCGLLRFWFIIFDSETKKCRILVRILLLYLFHSISFLLLFPISHSLLRIYLPLAVYLKPWWCLYPYQYLLHLKTKLQIQLLQIQFDLWIPNIPQSTSRQQVSHRLPQIIVIAFTFSEKIDRFPLLQTKQTRRWVQILVCHLHKQQSNLSHILRILVNWNQILYLPALWTWRILYGNLYSLEQISFNHLNNNLINLKIPICFNRKHVVVVTQKTHQTSKKIWETVNR